MKFRFYFFAFLLIFGRASDFYSTSLWYFQPDGYLGETNPLSVYFGIGWYGLIVANVLLNGFILFAFYYYTFSYRPKKTISIANNLMDFVSELYFIQKGRFYQVFYRTPNDKKILLAHFGYVMIRVVISGSILATTHNLCQFYNVAIYNSFRELVGRPLFVIYALMILSLIVFLYRLWRKEYRWAKLNTNFEQ
ncbi:MAG: hypothetical protein ACOYOA_08490 [Saprospiraceae bacterium]